MSVDDKRVRKMAVHDRFRADILKLVFPSGVGASQYEVIMPALRCIDDLWAIREGAPAEFIRHYVSGRAEQPVVDSTEYCEDCGDEIVDGLCGCNDETSHLIEHQKDRREGI